jgi:hypothetical protein
MLFTEIEKGLKKYSKYQANYKVFNDSQTLFYIVIDNNEVILLGSQNVVDGDKIHDFRNFVLTLDEIKKDYSFTEAQKLTVKCYLVKSSDDGYQQVSRKWYTLSVQKKSQTPKEFDNFIKLIKNNYIFLSAGFTLILTLYYVYIKYGLLEIGIPHDLINKENINEILFVFFTVVLSFYFTMALSFTLILPVIYLLFFLNPNHMSIFFTIVLLLIQIYISIKKYLLKKNMYSFFYKHIDSRLDKFFFKILPSSFLGYFSLFIIVMQSLLLVSFTFVLLLFPISYFIKKITIHDEPSFTEPTIFYSIYKATFNLPKIVLFNSDTSPYILLVKDTQNYYGYLYEDLIKFGDDNNSAKYHTFCKNTNFKDKDDVIIKLLKNSPLTNDSDNLKKFSIDFEYKKIDVNLSSLEMKCAQLKH